MGTLQQLLFGLLCAVFLDTLAASDTCQKTGQCLTDESISPNPMKGDSLMQTGTDSAVDKVSAVVEEESEVRVLSDAVVKERQEARIKLGKVGLTKCYYMHVQKVISA